MSWRERTLLVLTIIGFVVPNTITALFVIRHGLSLDGFFRHWGESLPATQLALDLIIAFVAFALWAAWEGRHLEMRSWWVPVPASILVGLCFALPLFLLLRERAVRSSAPGDGGDRRAERIPWVQGVQSGEDVSGGDVVVGHR